MEFILLSNSRNLGWEEEEERERKRMAPHAFTDFWDEREREEEGREILRERKSALSYMSENIKGMGEIFALKKAEEK